MKTMYSVCAALILLLVSCKKETVSVDSTLINEQTRLEMQTSLVGSWQIVEKGTEMAMYDGHICTDPANMSMDKMTYMVHWEKMSIDEKRLFKSNGTYDFFFNGGSISQGSYKVSNHAVLEVTNANQNSFEKIEALTPTLLIVSMGTVHYKFSKLD